MAIRAQSFEVGRVVLHEVADAVERLDLSVICCPVCEEVQCDAGCALEPVRPNPYAPQRDGGQDREGTSGDHDFVPLDGHPHRCGVEHPTECDEYGRPTVCADRLERHGPYREWDDR